MPSQQHFVNTLRLRQNGRHFADDISNTFSRTKIIFWIRKSLKFVSNLQQTSIGLIYFLSILKCWGIHKGVPFAPIFYNLERDLLARFEFGSTKQSCQTHLLCCVSWHNNQVLGLCNVVLTHWGRDKWPPFSRHFQMHFLEWKCVNCD